MKTHKKSKSIGSLIMLGDICIVGVTVDNKVIIYDKYTDSTRIVQRQVLEVIKQRNKVINSEFSLQKLSVYNSRAADIIIDRGLYIIGKIVKDQKVIAYKVFGSGAKPLNIPVEKLLECDRHYINARVKGGELNIEEQ